MGVGPSGGGSLDDMEAEDGQVGESPDKAAGSSKCKASTDELLAEMGLPTQGKVQCLDGSGVA